MIPVPLRHRTRHGRRCHRGVTLVELLAVMSILVVIAAALVPVVGRFNQSAALTTGANLVAGLIDEARQNARARNTLTALVLLTDHGTEDDFRSFTILRFEQGTGWLQMREWERLPKGVIVDFSAPESSFVSRKTSSIPFTAAEHRQHLPVRFRGRTVAFPESCSVRIFLPSGALQDPQTPTQLRLVYGFREHSSVTYTRANADGRPADFVDVTIIGATGSTRVTRL